MHINLYLANNYSYGMTSYNNVACKLCKRTSLMHTISHLSAISAVLSSVSPEAKEAGIG